MYLVRRTVLSCLLSVVACAPAGPKDDPLLALTGSQTLPDPVTLLDSDPIKALAALDGISTVAPTFVETGVMLNAGTVIAGQTVRVFEFAYDSGPGFAHALSGELSPSEYSASANGTLVVMLPLQPFKPRTCYMVVLTRGIRDVHGRRLKRAKAMVRASKASKQSKVMAYQVLKI